jgi:hypothetical protein
MKIKEGFVAREIAGQSVVIAVGAASKIFNGIIKLNETGKVIWTKLSEGVSKEETVDAILAEYEIDRATVEADYDNFVNTLVKAGIIE